MAIRRKKLRCRPVFLYGELKAYSPEKVSRTFSVFSAIDGAAQHNRASSGAGEESRTLDLYLGKVSLYQLSYSRIQKAFTL